MKMLKSSLFPVLILALQARCISSSCPNEWEEYGTRCYFYSSNQETMGNASVACQNMGSTLAEINSDDENIHLAAKIYYKQQGDFWIGLNDIQNEGVWVWDGSNKPLGRRYWGGGQPNNYRDEEDCVVLVRITGRWDDTRCFYHYRYICEMSAKDQDIVG